MGETENQLRHPNDFLKIKSESGSEDVHYSVFYKGLPDEYKLLAQEKLKETPENKEKGVRKLKAFMRKENLSCTDDVLITVLRSCKYNIRKSESKLKKFLKVRKSIIEKICRLDEKKLELILDDIPFTVLPYRDKYGRAVIVTKPTLHLDVYSMDDLEPAIMSLVLYLLNFPLSTVCGMSYIAEAKCESIFIFYTIAKGCTPYVYYAMDLPVRAGRADIVNENFICRLFFKAIRPILPEKLTKRIFFNGNNYDTLHKVYHPDLLPEDLEGNLAPINDKFYREDLLSFIQKLKAEGQNAKFAGT